MRTERSPKSVTCRIGPPFAGWTQRLVVPRSKNGAASQLPSGDKTCCHNQPSKGRRKAGIRPSNSDFPFSGLAFQTSTPPTAFSGGGPALSTQKSLRKSAAPRFVMFEAWAPLLPLSGVFSHPHVRLPGKIGGNIRAQPVPPASSIDRKTTESADFPPSQFRRPQLSTAQSPILVTSDLALHKSKRSQWPRNSRRS